MPVLSDPKREKFASLLSSGKSLTEAYKSAGYNAKHPGKAGSALAKRADVKSRVEELRRKISNEVARQTAHKVALTKEWVIEKLVENAQEALSVKGGSAVANRALELLGKELGLFREPEVKAPVKLEDLPQETLEAMLAEAEAKISGPLQ